MCTFSVMEGCAKKTVFLRQWKVEQLDPWRSKNVCRIERKKGEDSVYLGASSFPTTVNKEGPIDGNHGRFFFPIEIDTVVATKRTG
jgi:hypothetical protein